MFLGLPRFFGVQEDPGGSRDVLLSIDDNLITGTSNIGIYVKIASCYTYFWSYSSWFRDKTRSRINASS